MNQKNKVKTALKIILPLMLLVFSVKVFAVWDGPTGIPPSGNTEAPINVGTETQRKFGGLMVGGFRSDTYGLFDTYVRLGFTQQACQSSNLDLENTKGAQRYNPTLNVMEYCDGNIWQPIGAGATGIWSKLGTNIFNTILGDKVGIGTNNPSQKLQVEGGIRFEGNLRPHDSAGLPGQVLTSDGENGIPYWGTINAGTSGDGSGWTDEGPVVRLTTLTDNINIGDNTIIQKGGHRFIHTSSSGNGINSSLFVGVDAGNLSHTQDGLTGIGHGTLSNITSGAGDTALGMFALKSNTTGSNNIAVGNNSMGSNTIGQQNVAVGPASMSSNLSGNNNVAVGESALFNNVSGKENTAIGDNSLRNNIGNKNTAVGRLALQYNALGSNNTAIGFDAGVVSPQGEESLFNTTAIGAGAQVDANNKIRLGNAAITWIGGQVPWSSISDVRMKKNIKDLDLGLNFINSLRPVSYQMNTDADSDGVSFGLIAQEVKKVLGERETKLVQTDKTKEAIENIRYNDLIAPMIKAIQEQQKEIEDLKAEIEILKNK